MVIHRMSINATATELFERYLDQVLDSAEQAVNYTGKRLIEFLEVVARPVYILLILLGLILYFSHANKRLGKDMIKGGMALAILTEVLARLLPVIRF